MIHRLLTLIILILIAPACSNTATNPPTLPDPAGRMQNSQSIASHYLWAYYEIQVDPDQNKFEMIPMRLSQLHANVLPFLEPPAGVKLGISNLVFDGMICDVDVHLTHPFSGMSQYTGFDVAGIFISSGMKSGFADADLIMAESGDTRLLNHDGFTRWWNPAEFPTGKTIFSYVDGLLGTKNSTAHYSSTLNGYKLFADDLNENDNILSLDASKRNIFSAGVTNSRHYKIDFTGGVIFNYAVDANWEQPTGTPPYTPDEFPEDASRVEAWAVDVHEITNSLYNVGGDSGGELKLTIDVYDHFSANGTSNTVKIESPGNFAQAVAGDPIDGGVGYSTYEVEVNSATPSANSIDILITVESEATDYGGILPGKKVSAYFIYTASVSSEYYIAPTADLKATTSTFIQPGGTVSFDASGSTGTEPLTYEYDFNGDSVYGDSYTGNAKTPTHQFNDNGIFAVTVKVSNPVGEDISAPVMVQVGFDPNDIFVDADYTGGNSNGTWQKPFLTIQEGMNAVPSGKRVHVDYYDGGDHIYNTAGLVLKSNTSLLGDNWNGGGPGKPKLKNTSAYYTIGKTTQIINFTLEGFEVGLGELAGNQSNHGIYFYTGSAIKNSNITIRNCHVTDEIDDSGKSGGWSSPIYVNYCDNLLLEYNEVGPITWTSTSAAYTMRGMNAIDVAYCTNSVIKNNFMHDLTVDYYGNGSYLQLFTLHLFYCDDLTVNNNLICHLKGIGANQFRMEALMVESHTGTVGFEIYNNTIDSLDISQTISVHTLRGIFHYGPANNGANVKNMLITYYYPYNTSSIQAYYAMTSPPSYLSYSTGYNLGTVSNYFTNYILGNGCVNYPGVNPKYVNNTTAPYDYHFQSGSGCEMGDPNFIDWDDTGSPSGNPSETNIQNRSRMGCFGGPDGNWDPYDL